jgi:RNA polymerase sigma-70 factor (ECF subfamily)
MTSKNLLALSNILWAQRDLLYEMIGIKHRLRRTSVLTDAELVRIAQRGDATSLGILLERHRAPLHALALRFLGHGPDAQDAVQDAFLIALRTIDRLRESEAVGGWLRGILRNVCLRRLRERKQGEILFEKELPRGSVGSGFLESSVEETIDRMAMREWVWSALGKLPEDLQVTAMLRYFGTYASYEEISATLGVPMGTVKSRLNTAKLRLAEALLQTASLEHDEARRIVEARTNFFEAAYAEYNRAEGYDILSSAYSEEMMFSLPDGRVFTHGREYITKEWRETLEIGVQMRPEEVISSKDVAVIECDVDSPPEHPEHCPPVISQVAVYREGRIYRLHWYFPLRPAREEHWEETLPPEAEG